MWTRHYVTGNDITLHLIKHGVTDCNSCCFDSSLCRALLCRAVSCADLVGPLRTMWEQAKRLEQSVITAKRAVEQAETELRNQTDRKDILNKKLQVPITLTPTEH